MLATREDWNWVAEQVESERRAEATRILNRAWNHLWLDSEDTRPLGLELIVLSQALHEVKA